MPDPWPSKLTGKAVIEGGGCDALAELRKLAAARQTSANKLNEECRDADVWVPGNMNGAVRADDPRYAVSEGS